MNLLLVIEAIQACWVIGIIVMLFWKFRIGIASYLAYMLLVPYMNISLGPISLQWNFINMLALVAFFYDRSKYEDNPEIDWRPFIPFALYFGGCLLLMPFQETSSLAVQFDSWRLQAMKFLILPFVMWNDIIAEPKSLRLYRLVTLTCISIAIVYGLCLTLIPGINPYMMLMSAANGQEFNMAYAAGHSTNSHDLALADGRLFGRISSVFSHPMTFGLTLGFSFFYLYRNKDNYNKWGIYFMMILVLIGVIICGVRSVIGGALVAICFYLLQSRDFKLFILAAGIGSIAYALTPYIPVLNDYLGSMTDASSTNVSGSSISMRISQFKGCFEEIQNTQLEGKGFGWTSRYVAEHGGHPTLLHFESLIFVILCNSGFLGVLLWCAMGFLIFRYNNWSERKVASMLNALFVFYIAYASITGEYGYMQYFIIYYILMLAEDIEDEEREFYVTELETEEDPIEQSE